MAPQYPNISSRRSRPRQARPPLRPSRERSDVTRRLGQQALRSTANRYPQQREPRASSSGRSGHNNHQGGQASQHSEGGSGLGQAAMSMLVGQLLEEVVDYVVRHNFFRRQSNNSNSNNNNSPSAAATTSAATTTRETETHQQQQPHLQQSHSQSSLEERQRRRRHRRSEVLMTSLDRLSAELETTYDALMRVSHSGPPRGGGEGTTTTGTTTTPGGDEQQQQQLVANVNDLRRAITRSLARIESIRHHHRASRRGSRSARATRLGSAVSRGGSDLR